MRISIGLTVIVALVALGVVLVVGRALLQPNLPLIIKAGFSLDTITPNADGDSDVTEFSYSISRNARVSVYFGSQDGHQYFFRKDELRIGGDYQVLFSGVVDGYTLPNETINGEILSRLMRDGRYTWHLQAQDVQSGESDEKTGSLTLENGSTDLPELQSFSVAPSVFTPNQDGISDHTEVNTYLTKGADLTVYLDAPDGAIYIPDLQSCRKTGEAGRHCFDYDGGITLGAEPPPDGTYPVIAIAQDLEGQKIRQQSALTIQNGGRPEAEIAPQPDGVDVVFTTRPYDERYFTTAEKTGASIDAPNAPDDLGFHQITLPLDDLLVFKLTVENYGDVPIRTSGPWPGTVYQQDQIWGAMGVFEESGSWRVGIQCSTTTTSYPWRWSVGAKDDMVSEADPASGNTYYYLPAGAKSVVWGAVRMTSLVKARNPQQCWAGLIHEDVEVRDANVGSRDIELVGDSVQAGG
jgi:hypothetical protein